MDALLKIWRFIEPRVRVLMFLLFVVMLGATFAFYNMESPYDEDANQTRRGKPAELPDDRRPAQTVENALYKTPESIEKTAFASLIANSMFSVKTVKDQTEREAEANRKFAEARTLSAQGDTARALALVNEVLAIMPAHSEAQQLKRKLEGN